MMSTLRMEAGSHCMRAASRRSGLLILRTSTTWHWQSNKPAMNLFRRERQVLRCTWSVVPSKLTQLLSQCTRLIHKVKITVWFTSSRTTCMISQSRLRLMTSKKWGQLPYLNTAKRSTSGVQTQMASLDSRVVISADSPCLRVLTSTRRSSRCLVGLNTRLWSPYRSNSMSWVQINIVNSALVTRQIFRNALCLHWSNLWLIFKY